MADLQADWLGNMKYLALVMVTAVATWTIADWRHGYDLSQALDAKEKEIRDSVRQSMELETLLQSGRKQSEKQENEVIRYVELQSDDPVCFDTDALRLFNANRLQ